MDNLEAETFKKFSKKASISSKHYYQLQKIRKSLSPLVIIPRLT